MDLFDLLAVAHQHYFMPLAVPMMLFMLMNGGCCCSSCEFFSDDFNRSDNDDPGDYTEVSGDWDIASNVLSTASSSGVLIADTPHPDGEPNIKVSVTVNIATSGDTARIILDYVDSDNYWFAEVKAGTGAYLRIYQRSGGSNTQKNGIAMTRATGSFAMCASITDDSTMRASVGSVAVTEVSTFSSDEWGLGTGTLAGTVTFDDITADSTTAPDCSNNECASPIADTCPECLTNTSPSEMMLTIPGGSFATSGSPPCTLAECQAAEGTYFLPRDTSLGSTCFWRKCITGLTCDPIIEVRVSVEFSSPNYKIFAVVNGGGIATTCGSPSSPLHWSKFVYTIGTDEPDCTTFDNIELAYDSRNGDFRCYLDSSDTVFVSSA